MSTYAPNPFNAQHTGEDIHIAVIKTEWNSKITDALTDSCLRTLRARGVQPDAVETFTVPGAVELTFGASSIIESGLFDVVIVFGCVIRGGTPHFDYVCQSVTQGVTHLNAECDIPVIFGVLTVDTEEDAIVRCDGTVADKGAECADTALKMFAFAQHINEL